MSFKVHDGVICGGMNCSLFRKQSSKVKEGDVYIVYMSSQGVRVFGVILPHLCLVTFLSRLRR